MRFELLQKRWLQKIKEFSFQWKKPLLSLTVEDEDILFIYTLGNDGTVTVAGVWQVQWRNDEAYGGSNGYVFKEIAASGIEMVKVETLLQDEEYTFFEDVVARAKGFLEEQNSVSFVELVDGREIGVSAPERIHQVTPLLLDIRAIEHSWLLVFSGFKTYTSRTLFFLLEVAYHLQNQEWQFTINLLREGDEEIWSI